MLPVHFNQSINQFISRHSTKARETPVPVSVVSGRSSMKLGTNIHHVSGHCWKRYQGQRSKSRS